MIKPILKYPGAKWALAPWIVQHLPRMPHYVEPYCGSAAVFFNLPWRPKHAVLNDMSGDIVNLFRVIRERGDELAALIEMTPWAREEFDLSYTPTDNDTERARRFLVRTWQGHATGGADGIDKKNGWSKRTDLSVISTSTWNRLPRMLITAAKCLSTAEIENCDAIEFITYRNQPDVLLYVDPPYPLSTRAGKLYQHEMTDADHIALLDALDAHPGPVVLSGYACALYDDRLPHWHRVTTQAQAEKGNTRTEVLWLNDKAANSRQHTMELV